MKHIQASDAMTRLLQLLDDVERGETLVITRHGRAIARLIPETDQQQELIDQALQRIRARRERIGGASVDDLLSARDEGRRH